MHIFMAWMSAPITMFDIPQAFSKKKKNCLTFIEQSVDHKRSYFKKQVPNFKEQGLEKV